MSDPEPGVQPDRAAGARPRRLQSSIVSARLSLISSITT
jgi:hypothetical protein